MKKTLDIILLFNFMVTGCRLEEITNNTVEKEGGGTISLPSDYEIFSDSKTLLLQYALTISVK